MAFLDEATERRAVARAHAFARRIFSGDRGGGVGSTGWWAAVERVADGEDAIAVLWDEVEIRERYLGYQIVLTEEPSEPMRVLAQWLEEGAVERQGGES